MPLISNVGRLASHADHMGKLAASAVIWIPLLLFGKEIVAGVVAIFIVVALVALYYGAKMLYDLSADRKRILAEPTTYDMQTPNALWSMRSASQSVDYSDSITQRTKKPAGELSSALIVDEPWISLILSGQKTWEMRSTHVAKRGRIALMRGPSALCRPAHHLHFAAEEQFLLAPGAFRLFGKAVGIEPSFCRSASGKRKSHLLSSSRCRAQVLVVVHPRPE